MRTALGTIRRATRFAVAAALWLHAIFMVRVAPPRFTGLATWLHLTGAEVFIFILLAAFTLLATYGYGRLFWDILYIYFFPFVLLFILGRWVFFALVAINKFCSAGLPAGETVLAIPGISVAGATGPGPPGAEAAPKAKWKFTWNGLFVVLSRPLRRFTFLWCILLVLTTHSGLLEFALAVVLIHIVFALVAVLRVTVFSAGLLSKLEANIKQQAETLLSKIAFVTRDSEVTPDLRNTWTNASGIRMGLLVFQNRQLVSRWAVVLGSAFLGCVHIYMALLFSFAYYGIARVQSIAFTWPDAFVTSIFIPFAFGDLPRNPWLKFVGGIQCTTIVAVGAGTVINYLTRKVQDLQRVAMHLNERFADAEVRDRLLILDEKCKPPVAPSAVKGA